MPGWVLWPQRGQPGEGREGAQGPGGPRCLLLLDHARSRARHTGRLEKIRPALREEPGLALPDGKAGGDRDAPPRAGVRAAGSDPRPGQIVPRRLCQDRHRAPRAVGGRARSRPPSDHRELSPVDGAERRAPDALDVGRQERSFTHDGLIGSSLVGGGAAQRGVARVQHRPSRGRSSSDATVRSWPSLMFISDADTTTRSVTGSQKELLWQSRGADSLRKKPTIYYASAVHRRDRIAAPV